MNIPIARALAALFLILPGSAWPQEAVKTPAAAPGSVAATVNGEPITMNDWYGRMELLRGQEFLASTNPLRIKSATAGQIALESLIGQRLLMQYAGKNGLLPSDAEVEADLQNARKQPTIVQGLESKLFTEARLRNELRIQRAHYNILTAGTSVTPEQVRAYYDKHPDMWGAPERWRLAMIRVATPAAVEAVAAELKKGTPFAAVAAQYSEDAASKGKGGEIGTVPATGPGLPEFIRTAIKALKPGEVSPPLQANMNAPAGGTPQTVTLFVQLIARESGSAKPFEEVKAQAQRLALMEKAGGAAAAEKKLEELRRTATIVIHLPAYQSLYKR